MGRHRDAKAGSRAQAVGGDTLRVEQAAWGPASAEPTWVYVCRAWVPSVPRHLTDDAGPGVFELPDTTRHSTPDAFAGSLIQAASFVWREQLRRRT